MVLWLKKQLIYLFYIFLQFYLASLRGKDYFAKEPEPVGAECFWPYGAGAARKKIPGAGAAWEKNQEPEPEPLEKSQELEPEPLKNLPAPQPCLKLIEIIP